MEWFLVLVALACLVFGAEGQRVAVARFDARGVSGSITFTESGDNVEIVANLQGLRGEHAWHVHLFPVDQTVAPDVQCLGDFVGPHYDPFNRNPNPGLGGDAYRQRCSNNQTECEAGDLSGKFGFLMPNTPLTVTDNTGSLFLRDQFSIIGRSIVIHAPGDHNGANFECGTIRSMAEINGAAVTLLQSSFINPIGGTIYFRQVEGEDVQMWGKVYWTDDSSTTMDHNWHIHELAPGEEYRLGVCDTSDNILGHYRPFGNGPPGEVPNYNEICTPALTNGCEVGDLTGKHATITVEATPSPYSMSAFFFTDNFLNLTGVNPVLNRSVAIHVANRGAPVVACAPLIRSENIMLTQYSVEEITMSQGSPFEDTVITSTGSRTQTTLQDFAFNQLIQNCPASSDNVFSPYNPVMIPAPGVTTPDGRDLGALQDRYSAIGRATTQRLFDVPIYGADVSISSLNMRAVSGSGSTCSALVPPLTGANVIVAKASFSRVLRGAVYLIQENFGFGQLGNTHIIVDAYYANSSTRATMNHNWHVHVTASPPSNTMCSPTVGGHYNPFNVSLATATSDPMGVNSDYSTDCSSRYQLRCESGDMAGKHGRLNISPDGPSRPTYTYVDSNLQLTGEFTIIGRSMAVHDIIEGAPIFDCGTIERRFLSMNFVVRTVPSDMLRTAFTATLANAIEEVDPTDIIILNQEVVSLGFGFFCVDVSMRVLGPTPMMADAYAASLRDRGAAIFSCSSASRSAAITHATFLLPLLVALLYLAGHAK